MPIAGANSALVDSVLLPHGPKHSRPTKQLMYGKRAQLLREGRVGSRARDAADVTACARNSRFGKLDSRSQVRARSSRKSEAKRRAVESATATPGTKPRKVRGIDRMPQTLCRSVPGIAVAIQTAPVSSLLHELAHRHCTGFVRAHPLFPPVQDRAVWRDSHTKTKPIGILTRHGAGTAQAPDEAAAAAARRAAGGAA